MKLKYKVFDKELERPKYATKGSVGLDLVSRCDISIPIAKMVLVPLNIAVKTPEGYATKLYPRSSLFKKKGVILANSVGIIDQDYSGNNDEIMAALYNMSSKEVKIFKGERICQLVFTRVDQLELEEVNEMEDSNRGGFGSTDEEYKMNEEENNKE